MHNGVSSGEGQWPLFCCSFDDLCEPNGYMVSRAVFQMRRSRISLPLVGYDYEQCSLLGK